MYVITNFVLMFLFAVYCMTYYFENEDISQRIR